MGLHNMLDIRLATEFYVWDRARNNPVSLFRKGELIGATKFLKTFRKIKQGFLSNNIQVMGGFLSPQSSICGKHFDFFGNGKGMLYKRYLVHLF